VLFFRSSTKTILARRTYKCEEKSFPSPLVANSHNSATDGSIQNLQMPSCSARDSNLNGMYTKDHVGTEWPTSGRKTQLCFDEGEGR